MYYYGHLEDKSHILVNFFASTKKALIYIHFCKIKMVVCGLYLGHGTLAIKRDFRHNTVRAKYF